MEDTALAHEQLLLEVSASFGDHLVALGFVSIPPCPCEISTTFSRWGCVADVPSLRCV